MSFRIALIAMAGFLLSTATHAQTCNSAVPATTPTSRFTDHGNGSVSDTKTGLMWKQCSEGQATDGASGCNGTAATFTWQQALQRAQQVNADSAGERLGYLDWRVPNIKELKSLVEQACYFPSINEELFPSTPSSSFWSATPFAGNPSYALYGLFDFGGDGRHLKSDIRFVRLVRGGQSFDIGPPVTSITPTPIKVTNAAGLYVRQGPGTAYPAFTEISYDQQFVAFEKSEQGSDIWYKIHLPCGNGNPCSGWIAGTYSGITYSIEEPTATQVEATGTGMYGLNIRAYPGGSVIDSAWDDQRFVTLDTQPSGSGCYSNWYEIHLPLVSGASTGWVCGDYLRFSAYPITIDPWIQQAKLLASDSTYDDWFGYSVAISGDTLVVGAHANDDAGSSSGSVYIFERNQGGAGNWGEVRKLTASDAAGGDNFGYSVAISGDTVVVGAYTNDDAGSAYVFERNQGGEGNWGEARKLTASDAAEGDRFGYSVAISGNTVVVGAYTNDDAGSSAGSAYIFERNQGGMDNWGEIKKLTASDAASYYFFGFSVAVSGNTVVIGESQQGLFTTGQNRDVGAAYVFGRNQGGMDNWGEVKKLTASDASLGDLFGSSVTISGDTVVVGAPGNDDVGSSSGSAYVFERNQGGMDNWGEIKKLTASDAVSGDLFGRAIAISRDKVVAGVYLRDDVGANSGAAYIFVRDQGGANNWGEVKKLTASEVAEQALFGRAVAVSGDTITIGADGNHYYGNDSESAYVFQTAGSTTIAGGVILGRSPFPGVTITLTGTASDSAPTVANGNYTFPNLSAGAYTVTPSLSGYTFDPPLRDITLSGASVTGQDFRACQTNQSVTGLLTDQNGNPITGTDATLSVDNVLVPDAIDASGNYTVTGLSCGDYTITVSPAGTANFVPVSQPLDTFDSWSLNVQVTAESSSYGLDGLSGKGSDPVDTATGNYIYQSSDLEIPGIGMPFTFERSYNSRDDQNGPLGFNWTHNWNTSLELKPNGNVEIRWADGGTETWAPDGVGGFTQQSGIFDALIDDGGGAYTLRKKNLTEYHFDASGLLTSITDKNGNTIVLTYTGGNLTQVTDTAGRSIGFTYDAGNRITQITDPIGRTIQFAYDANGDLISATDPNGNTTTYTYDANHQILTVTDPLGNALVSNTYDAAKRVVTYQTDAKGGATTFVYDEVNRKTTFTDALGNATVHYHDSMLRLIKEENAKGGIALYEYDGQGSRVKVTDKNGNTTQYGYDANGNVISKTDALGNVTTITYNANNNPLTRSDALGNATSFSYDANGNLIQTQDVLLNTTVLTYNANGLPLTITDARGNTTTNTYDAEGNLIQVQDALGNITQYTYDGVGRRLTKVDALGRMTTFTYDNNNNLLTVTDPVGNTVTNTYDGNGNRLTTTDKNGNLTQFSYDEKDLLITTTDALSGTVTNSYDALDRRIAVQDKNGNTTQNSYDEVGNLVTQTDALGNSSQFTYDANGNRLSATGPNSNTTLYTYDVLNRREKVRDALGNTATTTYDQLGRVISVTNAKGQSTGFTYDKLGRLIQVLDANSGTVQYGYDENGNRTSMTDPNGNTTTHVYDVLNRLISKAEPLGNTTQYQYDAVGNLSQVTRPNGDVIRYAYDNLDRLTTITYPDTSTVSFSYDNNGNRIQMVDNLGTQSWIYDALNRRTAHTDPFGNTLGYGYDANGNRTSLTYPDGKTVSYGYDALNRQTTVTDWLANTTNYSYDAAGRLTDAALPNGATASYGYDNADRLTSLSNKKSDNSIISSYSYTLDAIGNHEAEERDEPLMPIFTPGTVAYTYDTENQLTDANGTANSFDNNGNMLAKGTDIYDYDYENRLIQTTIGGTTTQYQYDGLGNRYTRMQGGATTRFILDTNTSLTNVLAETDASNNITAYNLYGLGLIARIQPNGTASYYHYDSRGSTIALTDSSGATTDTYAYDPFGKPVNSTGSTDNPFTYIGRHGVLDEGDELFYIRARYYDSEQQRFVSKDAKAGNDRDGQSLNRYIYAMNSPVILIDVSGFSPKEGGANSIVSGSSDVLHEALVDRVALLKKLKAEARMAQYDYSAALIAESAYWDAWGDTLQGVHDALGSVSGLFTDGPKGAISGLLAQSSTLANITGFKRTANALDLAQFLVSSHSLAKSSRDLNKLMDAKNWSLFSKEAVRPLAEWGWSAKGWLGSLGI